MDTKLKAIRVPLVIEERTNTSVDRFVISNGLPLPLGKVFSADMLAVESKTGELIDAGFYPLQKWQDGSWRFVIVNFLTSLKAGGKEEYNLILGEGFKIPNLIKAEENAEGFTVDTGYLKFYIRKQGFNVFDRVWVDSSGKGNYTGDCSVVETHNRGITAVINGVEYTSAEGTVADTEMERNDGVQAVVRVTGKLGGPQGSKLDYKLWLKAWAGSSEVDVTLNIAKKDGASWDDYYEVGSISIDIPIVSSGKVEYLFGGKDGTHQGTVSEKACIYQNSSDSYLIANGKDQAQIKGSGKSDKSLNTGWASVISGKWGVGVAYRWFWQNYPSAFEINERGEISSQVWAAANKPLNFYTGVAKTTDFRFYFYDSSEEKDKTADRLKSFQKFTLAKAPTAWYCQQTKAVDARLVDLDPQNWPEEDQKYIKLFCDKFDQIYTNLVSDRDFHENYSEGKDAYGFMDFGDGWEYPDDFIKPGKWELTWWSNNYYDHPQCFFLQFYRTGELKYLDYALEHEYHLMDIDTASYDPIFGIPGEYKSCPSVMHIKRYNKRYTKENGEEDFTFMGQGGSWQFQGVEGLFSAYYLTGMKQAVDRGLESAEFAMKRNTLNLMSGARSGGHTLEGLAAAYAHTLDERYLNRMNEVWQIFIDQATTDFTGVDERIPYRPEYAPYVYYQNFGFQSGVGLGGVYKYRCYSPNIKGELGTDNIMYNTICQDIWGRNYPEKGINDGWNFEEQRWMQAADVLLAAGGWLHPIYPDKGILPILKQGAVQSMESGFPDRNKTFSQTFKYQWITQYELIKENMRNEAYASFTATPRNIKAGEKVVFNNQSLGMQTCRWDFGDGDSSDSTSVNITHIYNKPGKYNVQLMVADKEGNTKEFVIKEYIIVS